MLRALVVLIPLLLVCAACEDDDCPVCPDPPAGPAALTGTWSATFLTQDDFVEIVDWTFTQTDSSVSAIVQHAIYHSAPQTDTISGTLHFDGYLSLSGTKDDGFSQLGLHVHALMNASNDVCMGRISHTETVSGHTTSFIQAFSAERK